MLNQSSTRSMKAHSVTHVKYLDGWRGLAILLLLIGHFFPVPGIDLGIVGVNLFFVLSGFLMAGLLFEKKEPLGKFYRRRIARIIPAHFVFISLVTVVYAVLGVPISFREIFSAIVFVNNYVAPENGVGNSLMPMSHIWSLSVEEHSYILLSLVAIASRHHFFSAARGVGFLLAGCVFFAFCYWFLNPPKLEFAQWRHTEVAAYGLMGAAWWVASGKYLGENIRSTEIAPIILFAGVVLHWWSTPLIVRQILGVGCFVVALCLLTMNVGWFARLLSWKPLVKLGLWSYSLYLWQQPFHAWIQKSDENSALLALVMAIACGLASFYIIERPARNYLNENWGARKR